MKYGIENSLMSIDVLTLPPRTVIRQHMLSALGCYWLDQEGEILALPIETSTISDIDVTLKLCAVVLPDWGKSYGVDGAILVPVEACREGNNWQKVDWWLAAFLMLECWHERCWEHQHGPIHSYSSRLKGWDARVWDYAWVNRIGLFLRAWVATRAGKSEFELFGAMPVTEILMTHDVDAVSKTIPIRIKQGAFNFFNAVRMLAVGKIAKAKEKLITAFRFWLGSENWWTFSNLLNNESSAGIRAHFNLYADMRKKTPKCWLLDPGYVIFAPEIRKLIKQIKESGAVIGLHPTFDAWESAEIIQQQKELLEMASGVEVVSCRQHWLRFSWQKTWNAQEAAELKQDTTIMFNDRSGFRAAAALQWQPWNQRKKHSYALSELPTVMMDSHFYDYRSLSGEERRNEIKRWINEVSAVGGQIAVLWHPHTLTKDYGWEEGFYEMANMVREVNTCSVL